MQAVVDGARPSALARHASYPERSVAPGSGTAKSMTVVVPPCRAAIVPVTKSSEETTPPNASSKCVCASTPPGRT